MFPSSTAYFYNDFINIANPPPSKISSFFGGGKKNKPESESIVKNEEKEITTTMGKKMTVCYSGETNTDGKPHGEGMFTTKDGYMS